MIHPSLQQRFSALAILALLLAAALVSPPAAARSLEIILDASGSMNGALDAGGTKLAAAKQAVAEVVSGLDEQIDLALRAYGHQSPRSARDCEDTQLLVPFGTLDTAGQRVLEVTQALKAQGYTPITRVLGLAAADLSQRAAPRTIVLVSDGKETCTGDPCLTAQKLAEADAELSILTIGLGVDAQAQYQLECVARVARGAYYDASSTAELVAALQEAAAAAVEPAVEPAVEKITVKLPTRPQPGQLQITDPEFHQVMDAETGEKVGVVNRDNPSIELPAGLYNVAFADLLWKSVEVRPGETTTLKPARLRIERSQFHRLLDPETGEPVATISNDTDELSFVPGVFDITFGDALWRGVELKAGETVVLQPAIVAINGIPDGAWYPVLDAAGQPVAALRPGASSALLPPGEYLIEIEDQRVPAALTPGKTLEIDLQ